MQTPRKEPIIGNSFIYFDPEIEPDQYEAKQKISQIAIPSSVSRYQAGPHADVANDLRPFASGVYGRLVNPHDGLVKSFTASMISSRVAADHTRSQT
jgi:hypothetical protein